MFAPCALEGAINADTLPRIKAKIICGTANNQLSSLEIGDELHARGILYAPDYAVNAGGVMNVSLEIDGYNRERAMRLIRSIYHNLTRIFELSQRENIAPQRAADRIAESRILSIGKLKMPLGRSTPRLGNLRRLAADVAPGLSTRRDRPFRSRCCSATPPGARLRRRRAGRSPGSGGRCGPTTTPAPRRTTHCRAGRSSRQGRPGIDADETGLPVRIGTIEPLLPFGMPAQGPAPPAAFTADTGQHLAALYAVGIATQAEAEPAQFVEGIGIHARRAGAQIRCQRRTYAAETIAAFDTGTAETSAVTCRDTVGAGAQQQLAIQRPGELAAADLGQRIAPAQVPAGVQLRLRLAITPTITAEAAATIAAGFAEATPISPLLPSGRSWPAIQPRLSAALPAKLPCPASPSALCQAAQARAACTRSKRSAIARRDMSMLSKVADSARACACPDRLCNWPRGLCCHRQSTAAHRRPYRRPSPAASYRHQAR